MLVVGALGLVVNLVALVLLRGGATESLNVKGAYLEVVADTVGSVGVVIAGLLVAATGSSLWDTVIALAIAVFVAVRAVFLGREVLAVLGQHAPAGIVPAEAEAALVRSVPSSTCTTCTCGPSRPACTWPPCTSSATTGPTRRRCSPRRRPMLRERFAIDHATIQVEPRSARACVETSW